MKIKHWQGYGSVTAVKKSEEMTYDAWGDKKKVLQIEVSGEHEWGIIHDDKYDLFNWLVSKFDKSVKSYTDIESVRIVELPARKLTNGIPEPHVLYLFTLKTR